MKQIILSLFKIRNIKGVHKMMVTFKYITAFVILMATCTHVFANVYNVTVTADGTGANTLRGAITAADNAGGGPHTVTVPAGTYTLTLGEIAFGNRAQNVSIVGAGPASTIITTSSTNKARLFNIDPTGLVADIQTNISGIKFTGGFAIDGYGGGAIVCGGPRNIINITNCLFDNNTSNPNADILYQGGAVSCLSGGALKIDQCTFTNNVAPSRPTQSLPGRGGAVNYDCYNGGTSPSGSIYVTNCKFDNNTTGSGGFGGAIQVGGAPAAGQVLTVVISKNTFINNKAPNGFGGAINADNLFGSGAGFAFKIDYNRFVGNTAGAGNGSALQMGNYIGNVDATNNWWGCNGDPTSASRCADYPVRSPGGNSGTLTTVPFLQLKTVLSTTAVCVGAGSTATSGFTINSAGTTIPQDSLLAFVGLPITFGATLGTLSGQQTTIQTNGKATATYTGTASGAGTVYALVDNVPVNDAAATAAITVNAGVTIAAGGQPGSVALCANANTSLSVTASGATPFTYQWRKGTTNLANGVNANGATISGATTQTLTINSVKVADAGTDYNVVVTNSCGSVTSNNATITVNTAPVVSTPPANAVTCAGTTVSFTATASGSGTLTFQWYKGATLLINGATGSGSTIAISSTATTSTLTITNPGTADAATDYNVKVSSSVSCGTTSSSNAIFTVNALVNIAAGSQPVNATGCTGNPVTFSTTATGSGTLTFQWYKGATLLANGATGTGSVIAISSTATTSTLTINNASTADNATTYNVKITSSTGCNTFTSNNASLTISTPVTAIATSSSTESISNTNTIVTNSACGLIATIVPGVTNGVSGNVTSTVTVQSGVQVAVNGSPYAQRHYDIVPATNAATSTATLTLYFTQSDFTTYNIAVGSGNPLPIDAADAAGNKANLRIFQFHGTGTAPGNYSGGSEVIDPADNLIIWNSTYSRWEVTFNVTGFSGFYLANSTSQILPLQLVSFSGHTDGLQTSLQWKTSNEVNLASFEVERSIDGTNFTTIGQLSAGGNIYQFKDMPLVKARYYYRLKMIERDGKYAYSYIIAINMSKAAIALQVVPNPFADKLLINITSTQSSTTLLQLVSIGGKILLNKTATLQPGTNAVTLDGLGNFANGTYILKVINGTTNETMKVIKGQ